MFKTAVIFCFNIASIMAVITTLREKPETYVEWKIENFFDLPKESDFVINSPKFSFANSKWFLRIYPYGETTKNSLEFIGLYLVNSDYDEYTVKFKLGYKGNYDSELNAFDYENSFNKSKNSWGWPKHIKRSEILRLKDTVVPKGNLTVLCRARITKSIEVKPEITSSTGIKALSVDLKDLYTSKRFSDVTLIVKNKEFSAHKNVLSSRLTFFKAMLESIPDKVEITDCDPDSFEEFLLFVYTGKLVNVSSKKAMGLYQTAEKYNLTELQKECARSIAENDLSIDSFSDIYRFAKLHNDPVLIKSATEFFSSNIKSILLNENWEKFIIKDPLQGNELFLKYVEKKILN